MDGTGTVYKVELTRTPSLSLSIGVDCMSDELIATSTVRWDGGDSHVGCWVVVHAYKAEALCVPELRRSVIQRVREKQSRLWRRRRRTESQAVARASYNVTIVLFSSPVLVVDILADQ
jgi:hypothetical protein